MPLERCPRRAPRCLAAAAAILVLAAQPRPGHAGVDRWTFLGPPGGRSLGLAFDPADPAILYLGGDGGLWKSADAGATWWHLAAEGADAPLLVDPFDPRIVYRAPFGRIDRSSDGGVHWTTQRTSEDRLTALAADPRTPGTLYALSASHGVLKSLDRGRTWWDFSNGLAGLAFFTSLALDPAQPGTLYVSTRGGIYKSTDGAGHWSPAALGSVGAAVQGSLALGAAPGAPPGGPSTIYAFDGGGGGGGANGACLLRSADAGASWEAVPAPRLTAGAGCRDVAVDPRDAGRLYLLAGDGAVFRSRDGGGAWELAGRLPITFTALRLDPRDPRRLYALTGFAGYDGIARSADGGSTWQRVDEGFDASSVYRLATASGAPGTLYALADDGSAWKGAGYGESWTQLGIGQRSVELAADPFDPRHLLAAVASGLLASSDGGATWSAPPGGGPAGVGRIAFDPYVRGSILAGTGDGRVFASRDGGVSWAALGPVAASCQGCLPGAAAFAFDPTDPRRFYAVVDGELFATADGGAGWTALPEAGRDVRALVMDPSAPRTLYAGGCDGIRKSPDAGATWRPSHAGIAPLAGIGSVPPGGPPLHPPYFCVGLLAIDPRRPATLYADADGPLSRIYRSADAGASWAPLADPAALPGDAYVPDLALDPADSARLYAATGAFGVLTGRFDGAQPLRLGPPVGTPAAPRFTLSAAWEDFAGNAGPATPVPLTAASGYFWFFAPGSPELAVKVLDGGAVNGHLWTFYGSLTDVRFELTVADALTGAVRSYLNPAGRFASLGDTRSLPALQAAELPAAETAPFAGAVPCAAAPAALCLAGGRFRAEVAWRTAARAGAGQAVALADASGYFWFFAPEAAELFVKVLDGRAVNGHYWVFYGALSDVDYTLRVEDRATGEVRTYRNPVGRLASAGDTAAF